MGLSFLFAGVGINAVMQICELQSQNKFIYLYAIVTVTFLQIGKYPEYFSLV